MSIADELFVISDLHLGGEYGSPGDPLDRGFRICRHTRLLAAFIESLGRRPCAPGWRRELVINGDFVDFLAEEWPVGDRWRPFVADERAVCERLDAIVGRDAPVFDALREFVARGMRLTILLGNHDIELSLPSVRSRFIDMLGGNVGHVQFIYDGEAYAAGSVLIEHGNRYDSFNVVNHDALRRLRATASRREAPDGAAFTPPLGSLLVAAVMNDLKERYPFIDLLKPETEVTLPILLALAPEQRKRILFLASLWFRSTQHGLRPSGVPRIAGEIGAQRAGDQAIAEILSSREVDPLAINDFLATLVRPAGPDIARTVDIAAGRVSGVLGTLSLLAAAPAIPLRERLPALLAALRAAREDCSFNPKSERANYLQAASRLIRRGFGVVIFGHTHLAKDIELEGGRYLNCGTWCDLIRFPFEMLDDTSQSLEFVNKFLSLLTTGTMEELITFRPTYVHVLTNGGRSLASASLETFTEGDDDNEPAARH